MVDHGMISHHITCHLLLIIKHENKYLVNLVYIRSDLPTQVFNTGGWALECNPNDMSGFDKLLASDPTRLHPFLVSFLHFGCGVIII